MRQYILILALLTSGCGEQGDKNQNNKEVQGNKCFEYPKAVDSLQVRDLYESARWFVYTWHCDENYLPKDDTSRRITFGKLPLAFSNINVKNDTLEVNFNFLDNGKPILPSMTRDFKELTTGVAFDLKIKSKIYMLSPGGFSSIIKGGANRYENPLQPEVLNYIQSNWSQLDSCFKELARQKGINK